MEINYSFIIPHKDSQVELYRCIESIPDRNDIQIIVVDDASECQQFNQEFLTLHKVQLIVLPQSRTAGGARNRGLEFAIGKWILFADSDDYYVPGFLEILDSYKESDIDMLYFDVDDSLHPFIKFDVIHKALSCLDKKSINFLKYNVTNIWLKMFRREFLINNQIKFEEVASGNDVLFSLMSSYRANKIEYVSKKLYVYSYSGKSITYKKKTLAGMYETFLVHLKLVTFWKSIGVKRSSKYTKFHFFASLLKHYGIRFTLQLLLKILDNKKDIDRVKYDYVNYISINSPSI